MLYDYTDAHHMPIFPAVSALGNDWFQFNRYRRTLMLFGDDESTEIPDEINSLLQLQRLNIDRCRALQRLPVIRANQLLMMTHLHISECQSLTELPVSIEHLQRLTNLYVHNCASLSQLPPSLGKLARLKSLTLSNLPIQRLPDEICQLSALTLLFLPCCGNLTCLPNDLGNLYSIRTIDLTGTRQLRELPTSLGINAARDYSMVIIMSDTGIVFPPPDVYSIGTWNTLAWLSLRHTEKTRAQHTMMALRLHTTINRRDGMPTEIWQLVQRAVSKHLALKYAPRKEQAPQL